MSAESSTEVSRVNEGKKVFRNYDATEQRVLDHYRDMRTYETVEFYRRMEEKYSFDEGHYRRILTIEEAFDELENYEVGDNCLRVLTTREKPVLRLCSQTRDVPYP